MVTPTGKAVPLPLPSVCIIFVKPLVQVVDAVGVVQLTTALVLPEAAVAVIGFGQLLTLNIVGVPLQVQSV